MTKLFYIANIRIPTERAHSLQVMKMCEAFADNGVDIELVIPNKTDNIGESEVFEYYRVKNNFKIRKIPGTDLLGKTTHFGKLFYWIDCLSFLFNLYLFFDIKHESVVYSRDPLLLLPFFKQKCATWAEIHDIQTSQYFFWNNLKKVSGVVTITNYLKTVLIENSVSAEKIIVAPDAVDLNDFAKSITKEQAKVALTISPDKKSVIYIGLFDEWKGYQTLLEASDLLPSNVEVVMIGGEVDQVDLLRKKYPRVKFMGFMPYYQLAQNQKAADILVIPNSAKFPISKYFTSPLKLFTHMASNVPIIASDLPSLREIINETMANFFIPDDPKDLSRVIVATLNNYDEALGKAENAYRIVQEYSWQKRAKNIMNFFK